MDKIARIRAEIERHRQAISVLNEHTAPEQMSKTCAIFQYSDSILSELLSSLDTLSEEPDKSLEEAAEDAICMAFGGDPAYYGNKAEFSVDECMRLFIAGAEWQEEQDRSRKEANIKLANTDVPVDFDMEIAFNDIWEDAEIIIERNGKLDTTLTENMKALCHDFFESGKEWQKNQMLKDAVECELVCIKDCLAAILPIKKFRWTVGDKVRIVVLKEEED